MRLTISWVFVVAVILNACSRSGPEQIVKQYWDAKHWEDRLAFVKFPETVKPLMARYYAQAASSFPQPYVEIQKPDKADVPIGEWTEVIVTQSRSKNSLGMMITEVRKYNVQHTPTGYKIDWESSVPYNSMTAAEFNSTKPTNPVRFRAVATLSDIYPFGDAAFRRRHWSVTLTLRQNATFSNMQYLGVGFIERDSDNGKALYEVLRDGSDHAVTVDISFPNDPDFSFYFRIDKFVCSDWRRPE